MSDDQTPTVDETQSQDHDQDQPVEVVDAADLADESAESAEPTPEVTIEDAGPARKKLTIEIPPELIALRLGDSLSDLQAEAMVPGFRRGRAPMVLLEKKFGEDVRREVKSQLLGEAFSNAVEENELRVLGTPDMADPDEIDLPAEGEPLTFEVEVEVTPEFELPDLSGIEVKKPLLEVTDEQVDEELSRYCEGQGEMEPVEEPAAYGDVIIADLEIKSTADDVIESREAAMVYVPGESRNYKGVIAGIMVDELGKKLEGMEVGDTRTIAATGPQSHENEALRDQEIAIDLTAKRIERTQPLELSELVERMGFEDEQQLKDELRAQLEQRNEQEQQSAMQSQVIDALLEQTEFELPEGLSSRQTERVLQRRQIEMMYRGASQQEIEESLAEIRASSEEQARRDLKQFFILDKVAEELDVSVAEAEVNGRVAQMAMQQGRRPEKLRAELAQSGRLEQLYIQLREQKAIEQLLEKAEVVEISAEEWAKFNEENADND